jgi:rubredoxin
LELTGHRSACPDLQLPAAGYGAMKLEVVNVERRFDQTAFSTEIIDGRALSLTATYTCPRCAERVAFSKENFERRAASQRSNLEATLQRLLNEWASRNGEAGHPFLDWRCPGCGLATRVYAQPWAGGRHGDSGVNLTSVLEVHDENEARCPTSR